MTEKKRFTVDYDITVGNYCLHDECKSKGVDGYIAYLSDEERANNLCDLLNEQEETIQELLRYKYLVKALEEVSGSHYIEEIISDYSDGAVSNEKEQLELGKWHSEHGLSWEDGDVDD